MAEGDTIVRTAARLAPMAGERVAASAPNPRGRAAGVERIDGLVFEGVETRGKNLLLVFEGGLALHSHLGMNGSWRVYATGERWGRSPRSAWAVLSGGGWDAVQFGGPTIEVMTTSKMRRHPAITGLGPDILDEEFDLGRAVAGIRADPSRGIGDALLDQHLVAGIGNIFKSEACFAARVDPWRPVDDLSEEELHEVLAAARGLMLEAVKSGRYPFKVYKRRQGACPRCRGRISSRGQGDANRTTYWCPRCQA